MRSCPTWHGIRVIIGDVRGKGVDAILLPRHVLSAFRRSAVAVSAMEQQGVPKCRGNHMAAVTTWSGPERPASKRASHALAVHEPQQRSFPGHREALGRAPPGGYQSQHGYDPDALVATPHLPVEAALQDHEGSHFSLGFRRDVSGTEPTNMASSLIQGHAEHRTRMRNNVPATTRLLLSPKARPLSRRLTWATDPDRPPCG